MFPGGLFSKTEMSEVLTEILKVDPSFDKDTFLKLCEKDIIPNILEVCGSSLAPACICCKCLFIFATRQWRDLFLQAQSVWLFYCCNRLLLRACVCVSLRRQWSKGSWRCWRTGAMKRYIHPFTHWCSAFTDDTFHTHYKPELCVLPSNRQLLITFFADGVLHLFLYFFF